MALDLGARTSNTLRMLRATMLGQARPVILYHQITARCDCRCRFCDSWLDQPAEPDELPEEKITGLLHRARSAGMTTYVAWGGEPLLVGSLPLVLRHAQSGTGLRTMVCTSGSALAERADEIAPFTDRLLLSLEAVGQDHDRLRGAPGLFDRLVSGLQRYLGLTRGEVILWCNLSRLNSERTEDVARFAREHKVGVEFFPAAGLSASRPEIHLDADERRQVFGRVKALKRRGFPVLNSWYALKVMGSCRPFVCNMPLLSLQVTAGGAVYPCDPRIVPDLEPYGAIDTLDLNRLPSDEAFARATSGLRHCNRCQLPCVVDLCNWLPAQVLRKAANRSFYLLGPMLRR